MYAIGYGNIRGERRPNIGRHDGDDAQRLAIPRGFDFEVATAITARGNRDAANALAIEIFKAHARAIGQVGNEAQFFIAVSAVLNDFGQGLSFFCGEEVARDVGMVGAFADQGCVVDALRGHFYLFDGAIGCDGNGLGASLT